MKTVLKENHVHKQIKMQHRQLNFIAETFRKSFKVYYYGTKKQRV